MKKDTSLFLDEAKINIKAGDGGPGIVSFFLLKGSHKKIASGGSGGKGGDIIFKATKSISTLYGFKKKIHFKAENGQQGMPNNRQGRKGKDCIIYVPVGTIIKDNGVVCADLNEEGAQYVAAVGGIGGRGNASFVSQQRRFPGFAEKGEKVSDRWVSLELRLLADVALVGFPNAGKSAIISKISAAKPKIADYPFTTLTPNLGVVSVDNDSFVVADIPGLIEGAHSGIGLGDKFLRHIMRSKLVVYVLDLEVFLRNGEIDLINTFKILRNELKLYDTSLYKKSYFIVINKIDLVSQQDKVLVEKLENIKRKLRMISKRQVLQISAVTGKGLSELIKLMYEKLLKEKQINEKLTDEKILSEKLLFEDDLKLRKLNLSAEVKPLKQLPKKTKGAAYKVYSLNSLDKDLKKKFDLDKIEVIKQGNEYIIKNENLERMVSMTDLENEEALEYLKDKLKKMGIGDKLKKMGVPIGSTVIIKDLVFELLD